MYEFLLWLEQSALGEGLRSSGVWTYGLLNLAHILGVSTLFGSILVLDLRLIGLWKSVPIAALARPTVPLAGLGFAVALLSGICMLSVNATEYEGNPFMFYIKFPAIFLGVVNVILLELYSPWRQRNRRALEPAEERRLIGFGAFSLLIWLTAISGGRMIGYW